MTRVFRTAGLTILVVHLLALSAAAGLREDIERLVRNAQLRGATIAVSVRDTSSGTSLVAINADEPMTPASNMKLITTGAALHVLGPEFAFTTKLLRNEDRLIVVGDGDPALADPELLTETVVNGQQGIDVEAFLSLWTQPIVEAGITQISQIIVDDRIFDREFVHESWPADQLNKRYCAQVAGLNFHTNVLHFFPRPRPGQPPIVSDCQPAAPWLKLINDASSHDASNDRNDAWIARKLGTNELTFKGNVRFAYKMPVPVTVHDMPDFFGRLLSDRLTKAGVQVGGHRVAEKTDPKWEGQVIGPIITSPLTTVVTRCNRDSQNLYAEALLKRVGHAMTGEPGSWLNGTAIVRHVVHERLNDPSLASGIVIADGSGLSQDNRITAASMTAWLNSFANDARLGPIFIDSLAVAGQSGTLEKRYAGTNLHGARVQAKTGYISRVSCLSGYVTMPDGRRRSFSVLVNGFAPGGVSIAKKLQDQIVAAIAEDLAETAVTLGGE